MKILIFLCIIIPIIMVNGCSGVHSVSQNNSPYTISIRSSNKNGVTTNISDAAFMPGDFEITFQSKEMLNSSKFAVEINGIQFTTFKYFNFVDVQPELNKFSTKANISDEGNYIVRVMRATTTWNTNTFDTKTTYDTLLTKEFNVLPGGVYFCRSIENNREKGITNSGCGDINIMINNRGNKIDLCYMVNYELLPGREKGLFGMYELRDVKPGIGNLGKYNFPCNGASEYIITFKTKKDSDNYFWERTFY